MATKQDYKKIILKPNQDPISSIINDLFNCYMALVYDKIKYILAQVQKTDLPAKM